MLKYDINSLNVVHLENQDRMFYCSLSDSKQYGNSVLKFLYKLSSVIMFSSLLNEQDELVTLHKTAVIIWNNWISYLRQTWMVFKSRPKLKQNQLHVYD